MLEKKKNTLCLNIARLLFYLHSIITSLVAKCLPWITTEASFEALHYHPELTSTKGGHFLQALEELFQGTAWCQAYATLYRIGAQSPKSMTQAPAALAGWPVQQRWHQQQTPQGDNARDFPLHKGGKTASTRLFYWSFWSGHQQYLSKIPWNLR